MLRVARILDPISHGGEIIEGSENVIAEGLGVARIGDKVLCAYHYTQTIISGSLNTFANGRPIARDGDSISCGAEIIATAEQTFVN